MGKTAVVLECYISVFLSLFFFLAVIFPPPSPLLCVCVVWLSKSTIYVILLLLLMRGVAGFKAGGRESWRTRYRLPSVYVWFISKAVFEYIIPRLVLPICCFAQ